jgi:23S rRNA (cytidine1920-2'-O)/16S rRNA (cytidine1409-2'-O)-methyltransferase
VRRGLAPSRERAQADIAAGRVLVAGTVAERPARLVDAGEPVELLGEGPRFVSRGGDKLDAALDAFAIDVRGRRALDVGASTGGFTHCLLERGAAEVVAIDVGRGQLHERLRRDPRVVVRERTDVRDLDAADAADVGGPFDLVVVDVSFISLRTIAGALARLVRGDDAGAADLVVLVKPQFEAGRAEASKGRGVIRDPLVWARVLEEVRSALAEHDLVMMEAMVSPLTGADGNVEFLAHVRPHAAPVALDFDALVRQVAPAREHPR